MQSEIRKLKSIRGAGIYILISLLFFIGMFIGTTIEIIKIGLQWSEIVNGSISFPGSLLICGIFLLISVILLAIGALTNFITSLVILCTSWKSKWASNNKILWGLLSLLILLFIGIIVFGAIGVNRAREEGERSYNNSNYGQYPQYPQYPQYSNPYQPRDPWNNGNY